MASGRRSAGARTGPAGADPSSSHLARLIEAESAFEARLAAARGEAERIVAGARAEAAAAGLSESELDAAASRLRSRIAADTEARLAEIEATRLADACVWQANEETVARLAGAVLQRLLDPLVGGAP